MSTDTQNENVNEEVVTEEATPVVEDVVANETPVDPVEALVEERLAKMKANMDRMASERDDALKSKVEMEEAGKAATLARLKEEGKVQEALEMELAEAKARLDVYAKETVGLRRDNVLNDALAGMEFRNEKSRDMARQDIVGSLVQDADGQWTHSSGTNIRDYVEAYSKSEDNSFLFRVKSNSGTGAGTPAGAPSTDISKSIGEMSTTEILALAAKGKLGNFNL